MTNQVIKDFFEDQYKNGLSDRFVEGLSDDFNRIMKEFNDYLVRKHLGLESLTLNFHDVIGIIIEEICGFKLAAIKMQAEILMKSAKEAKATEGLQKGIMH